MQPLAFLAPKYALTPATVQVPGPAVAPLSGVVMPSVSVVSVMPGLDAVPPEALLLPLRPPHPASINASAEAPAMTRNAVRDRESLLMRDLASLFQDPPPRCPTGWSTTEWQVARQGRAWRASAAVRGSARGAATRGRRAGGTARPAGSRPATAPGGG